MSDPELDVSEVELVLSEFFEGERSEIDVSIPIIDGVLQFECEASAPTDEVIAFAKIHRDKLGINPLEMFKDDGLIKRMDIYEGYPETIQNRFAVIIGSLPNVERIHSGSRKENSSEEWFSIKYRIELSD